MYWYMYRTCTGRDPTVQYLKKLPEVPFSGSLILPSSPDRRPVFMRPISHMYACTVYMYAWGDSESPHDVPVLRYLQTVPVASVPVVSWRQDAHVYVHVLMHLHAATSTTGPEDDWVEFTSTRRRPIPIRTEERCCRERGEEIWGQNTPGFRNPRAAFTSRYTGSHSTVRKNTRKNTRTNKNTKTKPNANTE